MKIKLILSSLAAIALAACADLGFGVDLDSGVYDPYYYGNGYYGYPWGNVGWDWDYPLYSPPVSPPPRPPLIGGGPGPALPPQNNRPQVRPPMNGIPTTRPNGGERPGNGGLPSVTLPSTPAQNSGGSNNSHRGR